MIKASALVRKLEKGDWEAVVENDEDCYPVLYRVALQADEEGELKLFGTYGYPDDSPRCGTSLGDVVVEVAGVRFEARRIYEDELDEWEISGEEIDYDKGLTEGDLIEALESGDLPHYSPDDYYFDESKVAVEDLIDLCHEHPDFLVRTKDGKLLGFDDDAKIPKGSRKVKLDTVIKQLYKSGSVSYDV